MSFEHYVLLLLLLVFLSQLVLNSAQNSTLAPRCPPFSCGKLGEVGFPFSNTSNPECGLAVINCTESQERVQLLGQGEWYYVDYFKYNASKIVIYDQDLQSDLESNKCDSLDSFNQTWSTLLFLNVTNTRPFYKCKRESNSSSLSKFFKDKKLYSCTDCKNYDLYLYYQHHKSILPSLPENLSHLCSLVRLPYQPNSDNIRVSVRTKIRYNLTSLWNAKFTIIWRVPQSCLDCLHKGYQCQTNQKGGFECGNLEKDHLPKHKSTDLDDNSPKQKDTDLVNNSSKQKGKNVPNKVVIGFIAGGSGIILTCMVFIFVIMYCRRKNNKLAASSVLISQSMSFDPSLKPEPEKGSTYFQTPIFTYKELHEATNHFDDSKKLGDGGFGTVYHGKLRDGRVVAIKRLFEHNYKRVEQFMNEIAILSLLRHQNLVTLYGCTNRHCRELLLVYEYVPNGTVADHLHGNRADVGLLTWPIRLTIAIETADALAYLHASDIIHRDVKTNNILLDNGFHVKVADFGMSRLFPMDVTHVSTAPQGTPGYVDPEYYQCYQLNNRSDVYSFGVVLMELISSKPAVDIGRHRHEINLANMAINRIHNRALHELVDPCLGFESDSNVRDTITLVAELAFRCLQQEKEMRPCMVEVLETLRGIESEDYKKNKADETDISADARLLKSGQSLSPTSVTDKWVSKSTTPNTSN